MQMWIEESGCVRRDFLFFRNIVRKGDGITG